MRAPTRITLLLLSSLAGSSEVLADQHLPFQLHEDGSIIVTASLDGAGPFRFMLDTGSTRSAVTEQLAARLRLARSAMSETITPTGRVHRPLVQVGRLALGDSRLPPFLAMLVPEGAFGLRPGVDGVVGQDVLARFVYTIDYSRRVIIWDAEPSSIRSSARLALQVTNGRILVSLPQRSNDCILRFVPDSGTDSLVLFQRRESPTLAVTPLDVGVLRSMSGQRVVRRVLVDDLRVGDVRLRDQHAVMLTADHDETALGDGLLPLHLFTRVTFNGPMQYLVVEGLR
jgi:Aspartyl protease